MERTRMSYYYNFNYHVVAELDNTYHEHVRELQRFDREEYPPHSTLPEVKLLPPPKRVLYPGSWFHYGRSVYTIEPSPERDPNVVHIAKHFISEKDDKIRLMRYVYRLDQNRDVSSEVKKLRSMCIYNKKTRKTYLISYDSKKPFGKKKSKVVKRIITLGFKMSTISMALHIPAKGADSLVYKFVEMVKEEVLKVVPDAVMSPDPIMPHKENSRIRVPELHRIKADIDYVFYCLVIQAKVGRRIEWLRDMKYVESINSILEESDSLLFAWNRWSAHHSEVEEYKFRKKYLYKAVAALRKNPTKKTLNKCLMGPYYSNIAHKLLCVGQPHSTSNVVSALSSGKWHKSLQHMVTHIVNNFSCERTKEVINNLTAPVGYLFRDGSDRVVDLYARTARNIMELNGPVAIPRFELFKDTLEMAEELDLRVRVNKFDSEQTIRVLHDRLSGFINRDKINRRDYEHYPFVPLQCPNRTYNGYEFVQMLNADDLVNEGAQMNHCVGGARYIRNCIKGLSVIFSLRKDGKSIVTIELNADDFEVRQKYMHSDQRVTDPELLKIIETWNQQLQRIHRYDSSTYRDRARLAFEINYTALHANEDVPKQLKGLVDSFPSLEGEGKDLEEMKSELQTLLDEEGKDESDFKDVEVKVENFYGEEELKEEAKFLQDTMDEFRNIALAFD